MAQDVRVERVAVIIGTEAEPVRFQLECVDAFVTSRVLRGFSPVTITNDTGVLEQMLTATGQAGMGGDPG